MVFMSRDLQRLIAIAIFFAIFYCSQTNQHIHTRLGKIINWDPNKLGEKIAIIIILKCIKVHTVFCSKLTLKLSCPSNGRFWWFSVVASCDTGIASTNILKQCWLYVRLTHDFSHLLWITKLLFDLPLKILLVSILCTVESQLTTHIFISPL